MRLRRADEPTVPGSRADRPVLEAGRWSRCAALVAGLFSIAGTAGAAYTPEALLITSDFSAKVRVMDPVKKTIVYDYVPNNESLENCNQPGMSCFILGMHYLNQSGDDYLDMALYVSNSNEGVPEVDQGYTVIQRIRPTTPATQVWHMRTLDFSDVPDGQFYCSKSPTDPCDFIPEVGCEMQMVHELQIIREDPVAKTVTMVLADLFNERILQVTLNYDGGNSCGHVDWVLGATNAEWPSLAFPNGVQYIGDQPGGPYLLVTFYQWGEEQSGGGAIQMFHWSDDGWQHAWRFPEDTGSVVARLNTPHMGEFLVDPSTGKSWIGINHSRGAAEKWRSYRDYGGSFAMLVPGATLADRPTYLTEGVVYANTAKESSFSRDIDFLEDGSMLLIDAGGESTATTKYPARVFRVKQFYNGIQPNGKAGYYSTDHAQQNLLSIPSSSVIGEYACDYGSLFEADWVSGARLGKTLKAAAAAATLTCPKPR